MRDLFFERAKSYFKEDYDLFVNKISEPCTQGFFLNTLKAEASDILPFINFAYHKSSLTEESFYHDFESIGKTKAYELGLIYPQEIAASLTSSMIKKEDIKLIIDLCAAPGGKTINVLNRLKNNCLCISNDYNHTRALQLSQNIERLGLDNVVITNKKPADLAFQMANTADLVILDAPCSGEGMIRKYPEILDNYSLENIVNLANIQSELLENAYDLLAKDGLLLYSTCTYAFEEDEQQIINFLSKHHDMSIIEQDNDFSSALKGTCKLSPINDTEGQFICLMKKSGGINSIYRKLKPVKNKLVEEFINNNLNIENYYLYLLNDNYFLSNIEMPDLKNNVLKYGKLLGTIVDGKRFEPNHDIFRSNYYAKKFKYKVDLNDEEYDKFVSGCEIKFNQKNGYYLVTYKGLSLGYGKCANGILKNKYPKGLRRVI